MTAPDPAKRRKDKVLWTLFGVSLVFGAIIPSLLPPMTTPESVQVAVEQLNGSWVFFAARIATLVLCFVWLELDSRELDIRRPWWLNIGIVLLMPVFVPYYLYKTRPAGKRLPAIMGFFAAGFGVFVAMFVGMVLGLGMLPGTPTATPGI